MRTRVQLRSAILAILLAVGAGACGGGVRSAPPSRIILIVVDTLRRDHVSAYGSDVPTPNIDRLAARGQVFTSAVSSFHQTTMSMGALFTGRTPSIESGTRAHPLPWTSHTWCGLARFSNPDNAGGSGVPQGLTTLAEDLRAAGYWTIGVVTNTLLFRPAGYDQGFDDWTEIKPHMRRSRMLVENADLAGAKSVDALAGLVVNQHVGDALRRRERDAFFLYVHYLDVHDWWRRYVETARERPSYAKMVTLFDDVFGKLLDHLEAEGLLEDAVVVFTSDHGEVLTEKHLHLATYKHFGNPSFQEVLRIPLIVAPAIFENRTGLTRSEDIHGLIKRIAGLTDHRTPDLGHDELFLSEAKVQTYWKGRWKSVWFRDGHELILFDLQQDPQETRDVAEARPAIVNAHRQRIAALAERLASEADFDTELSDEDRKRLHALGYLE